MRYGYKGRVLLASHALSYMIESCLQLLSGLDDVQSLNAVYVYFTILF